jgi:hypothetical protein
MRESQKTRVGDAKLIFGKISYLFQLRKTFLNWMKFLIND